MHTIKITLNLLFEYQCTSGKFIRLPNRIESKLFLPNWNALLCVCLNAWHTGQPGKTEEPIKQCRLEANSRGGGGGPEET